MLIALGVIGVDAGGLQRDFDLARFRLLGVKAEATVELLEGAPQPAVAQVTDLEIDESVLAFGVDGIVSSGDWAGGNH